MSVEKFLVSAIAELPPRPTEIHASPCAHCPTVACQRSGVVDPESEEIRDACSRDQQIESAFRCAWRPEKLCKGYCDYLGITEEELR